MEMHGYLLNGFLQHAINIWVGDGERSLILEPEILEGCGCGEGSPKRQVRRNVYTDKQNKSGIRESGIVLTGAECAVCHTTITCHSLQNTEALTGRIIMKSAKPIHGVHNELS